MAEKRPSFKAGDSLGNYILDELLAEQGEYEIWRARQKSVNRVVEVELYFGPEHDKFLENARVKAAVDDGIMGAVYEAIIEDRVVGFAREKLKGTPLSRLAEDKASLLPSQVNQVILQVSTSLNALETKNLGHDSFTGDDIWLGERDTVRMTNLARTGAIEGETQSRAAFTEVLLSLLQLGQPGATRMQTLLQFIRGTENESPITWAKARQYAEQVNLQLAAPPSQAIDSARAATAELNTKKGVPVMLLGGVFAVVIVAAGFYFIEKTDKHEYAKLLTTIPEGQYRNDRGEVVALKAFQMDRQEVTIGEYNEFLEAFQSLSKEEQSALKPPGIPASKTNFRPTGWLELIHAAREESTWEGRVVSLDYPVIGVDWWDASTYARWKGGRLPRVNEWWAAFQYAKNEKSDAKAWHPVGQVGFGPHGLHGNVAEWLDEPSVNPAFPMQPPQPVIVGGSFRNPSRNAQSREWLKSKNIRRDDLGFRVVYLKP